MCSDAGESGGRSHRPTAQQWVLTGVLMVVDSMQAWNCYADGNGR